MPWPASTFVHPPRDQAPTRSRPAGGASHSVPPALILRPRHELPAPVTSPRKEGRRFPTHTAAWTTLKSSSSVPAQEEARCCTSLRRRENGSLSSNADPSCPGKRRTGTPGSPSTPPATLVRRSGRTATARICGLGCATTSAETPSCTARRSFASASVTLNRCSTSTEFRPSGRSSIATGNPGTHAPSNSITSTARRAWFPS